jgi:methylenetetrahydrofolate dehydrogenase (NADP+)/methenyltetrahydrofolate cyclohydrolase/formyltetrahydrofolate synthetase
MKSKAAEEVGIKFKYINLPAHTSVEYIVDTVKALNDDEEVSGILVQLPLGEHVGRDGERAVTEAISPEKDVDGCVVVSGQSTALIQTLRFHAYNIGHLSSRASEPLFSPCTPAGIIKLLESTGVPISGASAVVLGRSDIVGNPVTSMLRKMDATVTQCHRRTKNLEEIVRMDSLSS